MNTARTEASLLATVGSKRPRTRNTRAVGAGLLATFSLAATPASLPGLGPLRVGMSLEELRAATPGIEWKTGRPMKYSGQPTEYKADGVRIADLPFSAEVYARHHGAYGLTLEHASAAQDANECEQSARAVFAVIETQTGPMKPPGEMYRGEESEEIGARSTVKLSQVLSMADYKPISRAKLKNRNPERRWLRANTPGNYARSSTSEEVRCNDDGFMVLR